MIPARPRSRTWPLVYRDLCEWAVLYNLVCYERWGSDTLIIRDGLLRSTIFAQRSVPPGLRPDEGSGRANSAERKRDVFLVGLAKHSRVIERYRLAMAVEDVSGRAAVLRAGSAEAPGQGLRLARVCLVA